MNDKGKSSEIKKESKPKFHKSKMRAELIDSPIYNREMMQRLYDGIIQNIHVEMDKQGLSIRGLAEIANVNFGHISNMLNGKCNIGLETLIKIATALQMSPEEFFPYDCNKRRTNGQRFDEITKGLDLVSCNFLLDLCVDYCREFRRLKKEAFSDSNISRD